MYNRRPTDVHCMGCGTVSMVLVVSLSCQSPVPAHMECTTDVPLTAWSWLSHCPVSPLSHMECTTDVPLMYTAWSWLSHCPVSPLSHMECTMDVLLTACMVMEYTTDVPLMYTAWGVVQYLWSWLSHCPVCPLSHMECTTDVPLTYTDWWHDSLHNVNVIVASPAQRPCWINVILI